VVASQDTDFSPVSRKLSPGIVRGFFARLGEMMDRVDGVGLFRRFYDICREICDMSAIRLMSDGHDLAISALPEALNREIPTDCSFGLS
jgi:hypothetical protein